MPTSTSSSEPATAPRAEPAPAGPVVRSRLRVRGIVQGVGFRPFVYRLARREGLRGWVLNDGDGVLIEAAGAEAALAGFVRALRLECPPAARIEAVAELERARVAELPAAFVIRESARHGDATTLISPDLAVCDACLAELFDPSDPRYRYPYINCTHCGPRYSIVTALPYDRARTTMAAFPMCAHCETQYADPDDRRFHAQPVACPTCGPAYRLLGPEGRDLACPDPVAAAAQRLARGEILAVKGIGGYHLACDARDARAVAALRRRKVRKEKPFALMARDVDAVRAVAAPGPAELEALRSPARPIVLLSKRAAGLDARLLHALAPDNADIGVMLPYAPLHHLLFAAGAPELLVMTSANRSSEPIAYRDEEALRTLTGLADAFLVGERPIARRIDDSVVAVLGGTPTVIRRARGYAPAPVVSDPRFAATPPVLALGAGLKNSITLAVAGQAFVSQHLGDLDNLDAAMAFEETVRDLGAMYGVDPRGARVVHDLHPGYRSSRFARALGAPTLAVQHHRAHVASVLAEHGAWDARVLGLAFDGAGLGDDGTVWGGEAFLGSLTEGLARVAHLRPAWLPGGDAAARRPQQAAAGFLLAQADDAWEALLPARIVAVSRAVTASPGACPSTTSIGRLFDAAAGLLGFDRAMTFEGQAAMWLEALARNGARRDDPGYPLPFDGATWDHRTLLGALLRDVHRGVGAERCAWRVHAGIATGVVAAAERLAGAHGVGVVVLSGGVWQNRLLHELGVAGLRGCGLEPWWNLAVSPGDGGISLGQAALAAVAAEDGWREGHVSRDRM
ncbi:MAG TPA: carbamoyltransferase HypF [Trueperaceae bacterium]|nr:carbamoyltransferase HypF [Trueperaceae bacterium]